MNCTFVSIFWGGKMFQYFIVSVVLRRIKWQSRL